MQLDPITGALVPYEDMTATQKLDIANNRERMDVYYGTVEINEVFDFTKQTFFEYIPLTGECKTYDMPPLDLASEWE